MRSNDSVVIISLYINDTLTVVDDMFQSLFNQTLQNFDIFVQEDGPLPHDLATYLNDLYLKKQITSLHKRLENKGLAYSLNELIKRVSTLGYAYIFRMDGDDIASPKRIELQSRYLDQHPEVDVLGGWIEEFNTDTLEKQIIQYPEAHDEILKHMVKRSPLAHVTVAFRASFFKKFGFYNEHSKCEDLDLWVRAFHSGAKAHNLQEVLVYVRTNNAFFSRRKNQQRALELLQIKVNATKWFKFGVKGYILAIVHYLIWMSPTPLKQFFYKYFR